VEDEDSTNGGDIVLFIGVLTFVSDAFLPSLIFRFGGRTVFDLVVWFVCASFPRFGS
jgi:hypothetical protein